MKKRQDHINSVLKKLSGKLGTKLAGKMGKSRLLEIASDIADYKEQVGWDNSPQELRRLSDKIHYIPAQMGLNLNALRLSKGSQVQVHSALWRTLKSVFPSLQIRPTN